MNDLQQETEFFHSISKIVLNFVADKNKDLSIAKHKRKKGDFATQVDVDIENLIVNEIRKRFPQDQILAEEKHSNAEIQTGRIWIIDPICGTNNLQRGIRNFCSNIALADNNQLIASCVIDHSQNEYFWSVGDGKIYLSDTLYEPKQKRYNTMIDIDFGSVSYVDVYKREKHNRFLKKLISENIYYLCSFNTSLAFAYVAIRKIDGFLNSTSHPWDIAAASFLIQQIGGVITDLKGKPWTIESNGAIAAKNKEIHQKLLETYLSN